MSQATAVNDYDRFSFAVFLAGLLHAMLIFGVSFALSEKQPSATTLDITLAQTRSDKAPEKADFLAQMNQQGSGTLEERVELTTTELADFSAEEIQDTQPVQQQQSAPKPQQQDRGIITSNTTALIAPSNKNEQIYKEFEPKEGPAMDLLKRSLEIASLEAKLDRQRQDLSGRPRIRRLTASSTRYSSDALYMNSWLSKIEDVGNLNYPIEARKKNISGSLRMLVAIKADGTVSELKILDPSGHKVLDDSAKRIVRLAAPFAPFTEEMREQSDIIEIIRTWQFKQTLFSTNL